MSFAFPPLSLQPDVAELARLAAWLEHIFTETHAGKRDRYRIDLVLTDLATTLLMSAYPPGAPGTVDFSARLENRTLEVAIRDKGAAFDPLTELASERSQHPSETRIAGHTTLLLIRNCCDAARYARENEQNQLTLTFHLA